MGTQSQSQNVRQHIRGDSPCQPRGRVTAEMRVGRPRPVGQRPEGPAQDCEGGPDAAQGTLIADVTSHVTDGWHRGGKTLRKCISGGTSRRPFPGYTIPPRRLPEPPASLEPCGHCCPSSITRHPPYLHPCIQSVLLAPPGCPDAACSHLFRRPGSPLAACPNQLLSCGSFPVISPSRPLVMSIGQTEPPSQGHMPM